MPQRRNVAVFVLACGGCIIASYLALYQMHAIARVWDPIFGSGSERVLDSSMSRTIRRFTVIPDSALGALAYATEAVFALIASRRRWLHIVFIANSVALALAGLALVALQTFVIHAWCLLCLGSAAISWTILALAVIHGEDTIPARKLYDQRR